MHWIDPDHLPETSGVAGRGFPHPERSCARARDAQGRTDGDHVMPTGENWAAPRRNSDGSDADRVGAWPEKGILDTQLGPNRDGRKW